MHIGLHDAASITSLLLCQEAKNLAWEVSRPSMLYTVDDLNN
jgi:hypothetical protein